MGKPSRAFFVYAFLALCLILFLVSSPRQPQAIQHRRLKLRSSFSFSSPPAAHGHDREIPFDPVVAEMERRREDREWEKAHLSIPHHEPAPGEEAQPSWEDFMGDEDYLNDDQRFNLTHRLVSLFPSIDVNPADGFLSADELAQWNLQQEAAEVLHRTKRDMELHDKNRDGFVSFQEYQPPRWAQHQYDGHNLSEPGVGWLTEEHFNASDVDGDGLLNLTEFNDFLHPSDSTNPKLILWLCREEIRQRDKDRDGKLNFQEYFNGLFDSIRDLNEVHNSSHQSGGSTEPLAKKLFTEIDIDNDGFLSEEELKSVIGIIHPSEHFYAKQQADRALEEADTDKDGRLTLGEMIENPYAFYRAIFTDDDDYDEFHDELR